MKIKISDRQLLNNNIVAMASDNFRKKETVRLTIQDGQCIHIRPTGTQTYVDICMDGVGVEVLLQHVDINQAVEYFGVTELLDIIGRKELEAYLASLG